MKDLIIEILKSLVECESITPKSSGAIEYCQNFLANLGFECQRLDFENISNLYAKLGNYDKNLCFAGHIDVVPPQSGWIFNPFALTEKDGKLFGRGTNDMKGPLASALSSVFDFLQTNKPNFSISFALTSDEEIMGEFGTKKIVEVLKEKNEKISGCILCESCSPDESGEYIKIGCRGSLNVDLISKCRQCHVVNSKEFGNHLHSFINLLNVLANYKFDDGNSNFTPTNLEITSVDVQNDVRNIIPAEISAKLNIRFNDIWNFEKIETFLKSKIPEEIEVYFERFGHPFIGSDSNFTEFLKNSIKNSIGQAPSCGTSGGNSDAVFLKEITNVVEIGSPIKNAHISNEYILKEDLIKLKNIYSDIITNFVLYTQ